MAEHEPAGRRYRQAGTVLTDHTFTVPLDHDRPDGEQIEVFAREVTAARGLASQTADRTGQADRQSGPDLPWLVFLQGGPGFGALRPVGREAWLDRALDDYRVLLLDQRGTGRSTPASRHTLAERGSPQAQADYLANFRADSIVRDAELIRHQLAGGQPWSVLGQSFGGFCTVSYLSLAPEGLQEAFITGGLPGLEVTADDVYRATYPIVAERNRQHYDRYPQDADRAREIARYLVSHQVVMPDGGQLTVPAFQCLGRMLGMSTGSDTLHYLLEDAFAGGVLSDAFLSRVAAELSFAQAPLYAVVHEACYAQGAATRWAADRIQAEFPEFDPAAAVEGDIPLLFTGEMIYPWMFGTDPVLRPLQDVAEELAAREDWPRLYDPAQLAVSQVPAAAAVYYEDMYVPAEFSLATARATRGLRPWVTNEYQHDGLRVSSGAVLGRLIALARGQA
jgi:pimeloyl-ACP methyl ester carboxylesterase